MLAKVASIFSPAMEVDGYRQLFIYLNIFNRQMKQLRMSK